MRMVFTFGIAASLLAAASAHAEGAAMVATLLPPPVEAFASSVNAPESHTVSVPVLKQALQKGETITADNVTLQEIPASQSFTSTITGTDELVGQQAVRPLAAGAPINRLHVRVAPSISRNQAVTLVFKRGGIELTGRGQALEDGALGQSIRVINPTTRATLVGTVAAGAVVEVN